MGSRSCSTCTERPVGKVAKSHVAGNGRTGVGIIGDSTTRLKLCVCWRRDTAATLPSLVSLCATSPARRSPRKSFASSTRAPSGRFEGLACAQTRSVSCSPCTARRGSTRSGEFGAASTMALRSSRTLPSTCTCTMFLAIGGGGKDLRTTCEWPSATGKFCAVCRPSSASGAWRCPRTSRATATPRPMRPSACSRPRSWRRTGRRRMAGSSGTGVIAPGSMTVGTSRSASSAGGFRRRSLRMRQARRSKAAPRAVASLPRFAPRRNAAPWLLHQRCCDFAQRRHWKIHRWAEPLTAPRPRDPCSAGSVLP
mmetsp:Transcript_76920/g.223356  ORF Transcript_76920/g.223356 Transcript_76920/m.223356 type:complete len:310 (-) Transcript_76920:331-1260(-)